MAISAAVDGTVPGRDVSFHLPIRFPDGGQGIKLSFFKPYYTHRYTYIYICTYIYMCVSIYKYTHAHIYIYMYIYICILIFLYIYVCAYVYTSYVYLKPSLCHMPESSQNGP